jgi:hypothetical protein
MNTGNSRRVLLFDFAPKADQLKLHLGKLILLATHFPGLLAAQVTTDNAPLNLFEPPSNPT